MLSPPEAVPPEEQLQNPPTPPETEQAQPPISDLVIPPEELITAPPRVVSAEEDEAEQEKLVPVSPWLVVALNQRVNRDWEALLLRAPENTRRCYEDLRTAPMMRKPRRVFPLKGKRYRGVWEYEVTGGERVFYVPDDPQKCKVLVYYAGKHPKAAPTPP
ncbi:MAG: hypothetical protein KME01_07830 [Chroococcus sp. CMT-3BRIN-NPC107]|jgi:hypothetical protein|nr:hypothetical protein [Chroococcus sp. CMT-3BRIN-NPC107]